MATDSSRTERFDARLSATEKQLLEKAARLSGRSLTEFVVNSAREAAHRTIERYEGLVLTDPRDRAVFVAALLKPPRPNARLKAAVRRYRRATGQ